MASRHPSESPRPVGRPAIRPHPLDEGIVDRICEGLISGLSIKKVCAENDMPSVTAVYVEMARNPEFRNAIARAREAQQEAMIDNTIDMADEADESNYNVVKLRIWARQWRAAKLAPKKYGDKIAIGGDAENPLAVLLQSVQGTSIKPTPLDQESE